MERSFGDFEGKEINNWIQDTGYDIGDLRLNTNIGNIEPVKSVLARTKAFFDDLRSKYGDDDVILVVAHGQVSRGLHPVIFFICRLLYQYLLTSSLSIIKVAGH